MIGRFFGRLASAIERLLRRPPPRTTLLRAWPPCHLDNAELARAIAIADAKVRADRNPSRWVN